MILKKKEKHRTDISVLIEIQCIQQGVRTFLAMGILLNTFHRMMPTTTLSLR